MVAENPKRQNGHTPVGDPKTLSTVGKELARRGQRLRWNAKRRRAEIVNR